MPDIYGVTGLDWIDWVSNMDPCPTHGRRLL